MYKPIELIHNPIFDDLHHACKYDKEYFSKITASLGPLLKKLTTGKVAELLSPNYEDMDDPRPILDWLQVIRNRQIVYVGLDSLTDREVSTAVGNALFADLVSVAGRLYKHGLYDGFYKTATQRITCHGSACIPMNSMKSLAMNLCHCSIKREALALQSLPIPKPGQM